MLCTPARSTTLSGRRFAPCAPASSPWRKEATDPATGSLTKTKAPAILQEPKEGGRGQPRARLLSFVFCFTLSVRCGEAVSRRKSREEKEAHGLHMFLIVDNTVDNRTQTPFLRQIFSKCQDSLHPAIVRQAKRQVSICCPKQQTCLFY
jgi:hypothetical protein